ncbi:MAG: carbohydrate binding domain-containing protein, partial [Prevotella sp.]|nr:carbohydrate binding domain-containing protein [Prevotella sp.]
MKKQLLSIALLSAVVSGAMAHEIGDKVYSNSAKWKITGRNLVTNGDFSDLSLSGWTAIDETVDKLTTFSVLAGQGADGKNEIKVNDGQTDLKNGIWQTIAIQQGGTYIVSMKVMNTKAAGFTDFDLTGANTNYINAYYNTDGALATADGTNLSYGNGGECGGYTFSFTTDKFTEVNFPVQAPANGQIVIDLRGLSEGLEICDVTCQAAKQIYDTRIPEKRIAYIKSVLNSYEFSEDSYAELQEEITAVETLISDGADEGYDNAMENLDLAWENFVTANFSNVLNSINTGADGNYSANWDNWTGKFNKMSDASAQNAVSGWSWSTDRWCHKTAEANSPLQIQWMRGSSGTWDNIATNTTTLDKGTYFFGFQGAGGMMTLNKNRWTRSQAKECAETYVFFNNDTTEMFLLPTSNEMASTYGNVIYKFEVAEDNTPVKFGIRCNIGQGQVAKDGFDVNLFHPVLYKVLVEGELKPEQKTYLGNVQAQINALDGRIKVAEGYVAADQKTRPWGKENLQKGIVESKKRFDVWDAMSEDDRLATMDNYSAKYEATQAPYYVDGAYVLKDTTYIDNTEKALQNIIMNAGVRYINNEFISIFENYNAPLLNVAAVINTANETLENPLYADGDKTTFQSKISEAKTAYDAIVAATTDATREDDVTRLNELVDVLEAASEAFKKSAEISPIATFDFEGGYEKVDNEGEVTYVVKSTENNLSMVFADGQLSDKANDVYDYDLSYQIVKSKSEAINDGNILVIGNTANLLELTDAVAPTSDDVLRIDFTMYHPAWGNSAGTPEVLLLDADKNTIGGFRRGVWNAIDYCSFG